MLPIEIIYTILEFSGDLRILKRKMTRENIFQIKNKDIIDFIFDITDTPIRTGPYIYYPVYWDLLNGLREQRIVNKYNLSENILEKIVNVFINDYNNYYLDDEYYYATWMNAICYTNYEKSLVNEKKWDIESYRYDVFDEIYNFMKGNTIRNPIIH